MCIRRYRHTVKCCFVFLHEATPVQYVRRLISSHISTIGWKKLVIATNALLGLLEHCHIHNVDIIGCDLNQAAALRKSHKTPPLEEAINKFCINHRVTQDYPYNSLYGQSPQDVCGFIIMPTSPIYKECVVAKHGWQPFLNCDLGLRRTDGDAHFPAHMWLRNRSLKRKDLRSEEGWESKK